MQFNLVRVEEMRVRRCAVEQWMSHRMLPLNLRQRIRRHEQYKWQETRGVEEDSLIQNLPRDLRRDLKRHLCWSFLKKVSTYHIIIIPVQLQHVLFLVLFCYYMLFHVGSDLRTLYPPRTSLCVTTLDMVLLC